MQECRAAGAPRGCAAEAGGTVNTTAWFVARGGSGGRERALGLTLVLALVFTLGRPAPAHAQAGADVQRAIEVTQSVIDRAATTLNCAPGEERLCCVYLAQAQTLQASARASYGSGFYRDAAALTLRARDRAYSALRVATDATGGEFVRFSIERTDALLDRVAPPVRASGVDAALRLLDVAYDAQSRAKQAALTGQPRIAINATFQARERALTALRLSDGTRSATPERARAILERTDELIGDGAWLADAGGSAPPYERARGLQDQAHRRLDAGDARGAIDASQKARDALSKAYARADRPVQRAAVERELAANASALEQARARADDDPELQKTVGRAEEHHRRAQDHLREGRFAAALSELRASRDELGRVRP